MTKELQIIDPRRTSIVPVNPFRTRLVQHKRKKRNRAVNGMAVTAAVSIGLNIVLSVLVYILQAGPM